MSETIVIASLSPRRSSGSPGRRLSPWEDVTLPGIPMCTTIVSVELRISFDFTPLWCLSHIYPTTGVPPKPSPCLAVSRGSD